MNTPLHFVENAELVGNGSFVTDWNKVQNYKYITSTDIKATVDATISRNFPTCKTEQNLCIFSQRMELNDGMALKYSECLNILFANDLNLEGIH